MRADVLQQLAPRLGKSLALTKDVPPETRAAEAVRRLDLDGFAVLIDPTTEALEAVARFGAVRASQQLKLAVPKAEDFALPNDTVVQYAATRGAELVGKRVLDDGTIVDNPRPEYAITDGTRQMLQVTLTRAFTEEWTVADLERTLRDSYAFSSNRAALIARTEIGNALVEGNMATWRESGLVTKKRSLLGSEHDDKLDCMCAENAAAGAIDMDEPFPSGDLAPLYHPACACDCEGVLSDDTGADA